MSDEDGGPAFPTTELVEVPIMFGDVQTGATHHPIYRVGMSLRDYFAGQALASLVSEVDYARDDTLGADMIAATCYYYADAMLAWRTKERP